MVNPSEDTSGQSLKSTFNNTRRQFVAGTVGVLAAGGALTGSVLADEHEDDEDNEENGEEDSEENGEEEMPESEFEDDVAILNYALTLEYLEARFYQEGLDNIGEDALCNCNALEDDTYLQDRAFDELRTIQEHEESHIETLVSTIESLDGEPIEEPEFDFGLAVQYPMAFLGTAAQLEDIGVSAYAGAAPYIENEAVVAPALGIHSVEARHASFLRTLTGQTGFPAVIDEPRSRSEVLELAGGFIVDAEEDADDEDDETSDDEDDMPDEEEDSGNGNGNETDTENGTGNETDTGTGNETDTGNGTGNETDTGNGTGNETDTGNGTGNETSDSS